MPRLFLVVLAGFLLSPGVSQARIVVFSSGQTVKHLDSAAPGTIPGMRSLSVGYRYEYVAVFWLELWTWGGTYCLYQGSDTIPIANDAVMGARQHPATPLKTPWVYRYPPGLLILAGMCFCGVLAYRLWRRGSTDALSARSTDSQLCNAAVQ